MMFEDSLLQRVRDQFHHVDSCPHQGARIFFENAGGALTLKSVVETTATMAAIPDNQGRDNVASRALVESINHSKENMKLFFGIDSGQVFVGESGTELLFRLIRNAARATPEGGVMLGSTLEHPASASSRAQWAVDTGRENIRVVHNNDTGTVTVEDYRPYIRDDIRVATIIHTSPVTGMSVDIAAIAAAIKSASPDCFIIVDGVQHAAHGAVNLAESGVDGYVISPYKVFSRHGYGVAWVSDRLGLAPHEQLDGAPEEQWELGTRDTGSYATFTDVVEYLDWLGNQFTNATDRRERLEAAAIAVAAHEKALVNLMLYGNDKQAGLVDMPAVSIIGGVENDAREGLVALNVENMPAIDVVEALNQQGIRVHVRKADHYSGNILLPLDLDSCVRVSMCHYNSSGEVLAFLKAMQKISGA